MNWPSFYRKARDHVDKTLDIEFAHMESFGPHSMSPAYSVTLGVSLCRRD